MPGVLSSLCEWRAIAVNYAKRSRGYRVIRHAVLLGLVALIADLFTEVPLC